MNESKLVEVFGSTDRFRALRTLFGEPDRGFGQRELAVQAGVDPGAIARLLKRWCAAGLVTRVVRDGLPRYYASSDPALRALTTLMQQDSDTVRSLQAFFETRDDVQLALIFGSIARGTQETASDIDLLVLGRASELKLNAQLKPLGRELGRAIHATVCSMEVFKNQIRSGESFAREVVQRPRINLVGDFDAAVLQGSER